MDPSPRNPADALLRMLETTARQRSLRRADLERLQKNADEYEELQATLEALPAKVEHKILVPFGKLAFFPGSLRHTNEIMVLLGDNYFAQRSAQQAAAIASRRAEYVRPQVAVAQAEVNQLSAQLKQIRAYGEAQDVQPGTFEIREPYEDDDDDDDDDDDTPAMPAAEEEEEEGEEAEELSHSRTRSSSNSSGGGSSACSPHDGHSGVGARRAASAVMPCADSDDDTEEEDDSGARPGLAPLGREPTARATRTVRFAASDGEPQDSRGIGGRTSAAGKATPPQGPAPPKAFGERVVERASPEPSSEVDITMREVSREAAHRQQARAAPSGDWGSDEPPATHPQDNMGAHDAVPAADGARPVSRFKANRLRKT